MKKISLAILAICLISISAFAGTSGVTNKVTKQSQPGLVGDNTLQARTAEFNDDVVTKLDTMTAAGGISGANLAADSVQAAAIGTIAQIDSAATTTNTLYTPAFIGQILVGNTGSTGTFWTAKGLTTNDWVGGNLD